MFQLPWSLAALVLMLAVASAADAASGKVKIIHNNGYAGLDCSAPGEAVEPSCDASLEGEPSVPTAVEASVETPVASADGQVKIIHVG